MIEYNRYNEEFDLQTVELQRAEQEKKAREIVDVISNRIIIISNYIKEGRKYYIEELVKPCYALIKEGFEFDFFRHTPIYFKFQEGGELFSLRFTNFITNIMMWSPIVELDYEKLNEEYLIDAGNISSDMIKEYIDNKIIIPYQEEIDSKELNIVIHDMLFDLGKISRDFNPIMGMSINEETFIDLANRFPRFDEILHTDLPEEMQPSEIEEHLRNLTDEHVSIIVNDPEDNFIKPLFLSGTGIKKEQYKEFAVNGGLKPDLGNSTMPVPINSNFLNGGLNSVHSLYIDSIGGRKSLIMNATVMGYTCCPL